MATKMATIVLEGGEEVKVAGWRGTIQGISPTGESYRRPGGAVESQQTGDAAEPSQIQFVALHTSEIQANASKELIESTPWTEIKAIDQNGRTYPRLLVLEARTAIRRGRYPFDGTAYTFRVSISMTVQVLP